MGAAHLGWVQLSDRKRKRWRRTKEEKEDNTFLVVLTNQRWLHA